MCLGIPMQIKSIDGNEASIKNAVEVLRQGKIIAVKGIGGYHLLKAVVNAYSKSWKMILCHESVSENA